MKIRRYVVWRIVKGKEDEKIAEVDAVSMAAAMSIFSFSKACEEATSRSDEEWACYDFREVKE